MSLKWTRNQSDSGILRKNDVKEKKEELFVFGYSCKLFRDDEKALHIDQGKHLIPWMGDETLKIDRYDARGALHNLRNLEAPPGGFDWRVELTKNEQDVEQLCDEERYRALHTDEDEEEMYREEELKRLHAAGYGQVGFNYETPAQPLLPPAEPDEPFIPPPALTALLTEDIVLPDTEKLNAIIEKTAKFIASQGAQMEILLRAKQADNPQFQFLGKESLLHKYYMELTALVKAGKWPEKVPEEPPPEEKPQENEEYLHPSLGSTLIEAAPSIPSIHYRPSADCDYTLLISKMRGDVTLDEPYEPPPAPGDEAPPGTTPLALPTAPSVNLAHHIARAPVLYSQQTAEQQASQAYYENYAAYYQQYMAAHPTPPAPAPPAPAPAPPALAAPPASVAPPAPAAVVKSTGLKLMDNYNTDSDSDGSESPPPSPSPPPAETQLVIDKMAMYVARNGDEFADIVRARKDPRFAFLEPAHAHHAWYRRRMRGMRAEQGAGKSIAPVSFSIKKLKEPDPVLPKPALPYESSGSEGDGEGEEAPQEALKAPQEAPKAPVAEAPMIYRVESIPQIVKVDVPVVTAPVIVQKPEEVTKKSETPPTQRVEKTKTFVEVVKSRSATPTERRRERDEAMAKKEKRLKEERRREERRREKRRKRKEEEVITLEEAEEMIDLTGDVSDTKEKVEDLEAEKAKQLERRRRAAEFLKKVGVDPAGAAALPASSLASAMVDTLESIRKKKAEEEEKRRKKEKKRHKDRYDNGERRGRRRRADDEDSECDSSSKKKKRKKDKKRSKNKKKKRRESSEGSGGEVEEGVVMPSIDLTSTLKELRQCSPTRQLEAMLEGECRVAIDSSSDEDSEAARREQPRGPRGEREYSEGEWSSGSGDGPRTE